MAYLHIYKNSPTAGATDGTQVSEGDGTTPISVTLDTATNEVSAAITLAIRCETGYVTNASTTITPSGTSAASWALSADNVTWGAYGAALTLASGLTAVNTLFYAKAKAVSSETPQTDETVDLTVACATIDAA